MDIDFIKENYLMLNILFYVMNSDWKILSMFSLLRAHPSFDKKTTTMNRLREKIAQATLEINESSCFYPKARWRDSNKFLYIDKCKYDRNKYNDSSYSGGNKLLILFVWSSFNPLLTQWMNKTDGIYFSRFFFFYGFRYQHNQSFLNEDVILASCIILCVKDMRLYRMTSAKRLKKKKLV